jgi:hypothetical protein
MDRNKILSHLIFFLIVSALVFTPVLPVRALQMQNIAAKRTLATDRLSQYPTLAFAPEVREAAHSLPLQAAAQDIIKYVGTGDLVWDYRDDSIGVDLKNVCPINNVPAELDLSPDGTFSLLMDQIKDFPEKLFSGGEMHCTYTATGRVLFTGTYTTNPNRLQFLQFQQTREVYSGDGSFDDTSASGTVSAPGTFNGDSLTIHLTFRLNLVQAAITSEYIFNTYGIRVEDSFGGDKYAQTAWSGHELSLLNDVLKELPPGFLTRISLTRIVRNKVAIDDNGNILPKARGVYTHCIVDTVNCPGSFTTIRIFDAAATNLSDFPNDPDTQFKATILHEITHAYQAYKDGNSIYKDLNDSPQSQNFRDATRPKRGENDTSFRNGWYWDPLSEDYTNFLFKNDNLPPTQYGMTHPLEDMSDSVKMYVYDPQRLKTSSMDRYNYIRDYMFGGIEYDKGIQKKP